ncbi:MAG: CinA family protein [Opitutales bacterium]
MSELKELMLREPRLTLAVAESLTCGNVQAQVGRIPGASGFFLGGITAYTLDQKVRHLGVDRTAAAAVDCVSASVAEQMARGAATLFGADIGLATTGYAEPAPKVPVPFAWWALARHTPAGWQVQSARIECPGAARVQVQAQVSATVLTALLTHLRASR